MKYHVGNRVKVNRFYAIMPRLIGQVGEVRRINATYTYVQLDDDNSDMLDGKTVAFTNIELDPVSKP